MATTNTETAPSPRLAPTLALLPVRIPLALPGRRRPGPDALAPAAGRAAGCPGRTPGQPATRPACPADEPAAGVGLAWVDLAKVTAVETQRPADEP